MKMSEVTTYHADYFRIARAALGEANELEDK